MSDEAVLRLAGKLVSRATTLMFCTFPDSDRNIMKNAEQKNQSKYTGRGGFCPGQFQLFAPSGIECAPSGICCLEGKEEISESLSIREPRPGEELYRTA